jgi:hypothetical protein
MAMSTATREGTVEAFLIEGCQPLSGTITPAGNKNAALPILAACLLTGEPVILEKRSFRRFLADDVPMNTVAVIDLPPSVRATVDRRYLVVLTLVIGGAMILALARALNRR